MGKTKPMRLQCTCSGEGQFLELWAFLGNLPQYYRQDARSADEFSTSSTSSAHPQDLYVLLLMGGRGLCTQSVRPFVQNSSCEARCQEEYSRRDVFVPVDIGVSMSANNSIGMANRSGYWCSDKAET